MPQFHHLLLLLSSGRSLVTSIAFPLVYNGLYKDSQAFSGDAEILGIWLVIYMDDMLQAEAIGSFPDVMFLLKKPGVNYQQQKNLSWLQPKK